MNRERIIAPYITKDEDERTDIAKQDFKNARCINIDASHTVNQQAKAKPELL